ncbi:hypothetical protein Tco_0963553 [Tanacetum coccineum]
MYRPPFEPSRQEEFEHIVMNFIFDQEERIGQLKNYMQVITEEFMEFSSEVARRLKERIKENDNKTRKIKKITKYPDTKVLENSAKHNFLENLEKKTFPTPVNLLQLAKELGTLGGKPPHLAKKQWKKRYEPLHKGVTFRLGGVEREMSLLEFGWRVGLYTERESRDVMTLSGLRRAETVNSTHLTHLFWPSIGDDKFNVGNTKAKSIRDPRIKLAHQKKSVVKMGVIMELHKGESCWPATRGVIEEDEGDDEEGDGEGGNEGDEGSADIYRNMSAGDWQFRQARWMDQQDNQWGRLDAWMEQQDQRAH